MTFTYRSDEFEEDIDDSLQSHHSRRKKTPAQNTEDDEDDDHQKSFTFWTKLTFGEVVPVPALQSSPSVANTVEKKRGEGPTT